MRRQQVRTLEAKRPPLSTDFLIKHHHVQGCLHAYLYQERIRWKCERVWHCLIETYQHSLPSWLGRWCCSFNECRSRRCMRKFWEQVRRLALIVFLFISPFQWEAGQETFPGYKKKGDGHLSHLEYATAYSGGCFLNDFLNKLIESIRRTPLSSVRRR